MLLCESVTTSMNQRAHLSRLALPLAGSTLAMSMALGGGGLVLQLFLASRSASTLLIGALSSLSAGGILIGGILWGTASDHLQRRSLLGTLALALSVVIGVLATLPPAGVTLASAFLQRFLLAGFTTVGIAMVSMSSTAARRGKDVSYVFSAGAAGRALGLLAIGFLLESLGFRWTFALLALLPIAAFALSMTLSGEQAQDPRAERHGTWGQLRAQGLVDLYLAAGLRQMAVFGTVSLLYVYMDSIGIRAGLMGVVSSLNMFMQVIALIAFGWLADRVGRRGIFVFGFILSAVTPCLFAVLSSISGMAIAYVFHGLGFSAIHVGSTAYIGDRAPRDRQGQMLGLFESSRGLGGLFGPLLAGALTPLIGFSGMFFAMAGVAGVGVLLVVVRHSRVRCLRLPLV